MGPHVHQVALFLSLLWVDELDWTHIWQNLIGFSSEHFSNHLTRMHVREYLSRTRANPFCANFHDAPSPTEIVRNDVLLTKIMGSWHCRLEKMDSRLETLSPIFTRILSFSSMLNNLATSNFFENSLLFLTEFETFGKLSI